MKKILIAIFGLLTSFNTNAQVAENLKYRNSQMKFRALADMGFLWAVSNKVQFGQDGTYFDYVKDGGQDVLFPVTRFSVEMDYKKRNAFILLYQPLRLESEVYLNNDVKFNGTTFPAKSGMKCLYNFPFYRLSYLRELLPKNPKYDFAIGASLQIRNANITFKSLDGTRFTRNGGVGPVPALKFRGKMKLNSFLYAQLETDGMYAPISYLNGSDNEIVGAIVDANLSAGAKVNNRNNIFINLRYLGGGAVGTNPDDPGPGDGYVRNWLHFVIGSVGFAYNF